MIYWEKVKQTDMGLLFPHLKMVRMMAFEKLNNCEL